MEGTQSINADCMRNKIYFMEMSTGESIVAIWEGSFWPFLIKLIYSEVIKLDSVYVSSSQGHCLC